MSRSPILLPSNDIPADAPTPLVEDILSAAWRTVDTLPDCHPLRAPLIYAVWAVKDAVDADTCLAAALPIVVGLVAVVSA